MNDIDYMNYLRVVGPREDIERFAKKAAPLRRGQPPGVDMDFLGNVLPIPEEILKAGKDRVSEWQDENWGCAPGLDDFYCNDSIGHYSFATDYSPAVKFLCRIAPAWPTLTFYLEYMEQEEYRLRGFVKVHGHSWEILVVDDFDEDEAGEPRVPSPRKGTGVIDFI